MKDSPNIHEFRHNGSMDSKGKISFHDIHGTTMSEIDMKQRGDGLWFTTNPVLKPPILLPLKHKSPTATTTRHIHSAKIATVRYDRANEKPLQAQRDTTYCECTHMQRSNNHNTQHPTDASALTTVHDTFQGNTAVRNKTQATGQHHYQKPFNTLSYGTNN
jgi:hypothetical protein